MYRLTSIEIEQLVKIAYTTGLGVVFTAVVDREVRSKVVHMDAYTFRCKNGTMWFYAPFHSFYVEGWEALKDKKLTLLVLG